MKEIDDLRRVNANTLEFNLHTKKTIDRLLEIIGWAIEENRLKTENHYCFILPEFYEEYNLSKEDVVFAIYEFNRRYRNLIRVIYKLDFTKTENIDSEDIISEEELVNLYINYNGHINNPDGEALYKIEDVLMIWVTLEPGIVKFQKVNNDRIPRTAI